MIDWEDVRRRNVIISDKARTWEAAGIIRRAARALAEAGVKDVPAAVAFFRACRPGSVPNLGKKSIDQALGVLLQMAPELLPPEMSVSAAQARLDAAKAAHAIAEHELSSARAALREVEAVIRERALADAANIQPPPQENSADRALRALAMRSEGKTFREIGVAFGVGGQRARQIVAKAERILRYRADNC